MSAPPAVFQIFIFAVVRIMIFSDSRVVPVVGTCNAQRAGARSNEGERVAPCLWGSVGHLPVVWKMGAHFRPKVKLDYIRSYFAVYCKEEWTFNTDRGT